MNEVDQDEEDNTDPERPARSRFLVRLRHYLARPWSLRVTVSRRRGLSQDAFHQNTQAKLISSLNSSDSSFSPVVAPPAPSPSPSPSPSCLTMACSSGNTNPNPPGSVLTQIDYVNHFIPNMRDILQCPYYWGKIDRYEAESQLENKPEGSFLLRDSAQDEFVFSVSFRRYNRSLHARIEESKHKFSFDCHDPGVHSSKSISGLLDHYKDPFSCMFFEPMLLHPVNRTSTFSLQELCRAVINDHCSYNNVSQLTLPKTLKEFLREYNYKHKIRIRQIDCS